MDTSRTAGDTRRKGLLRYRTAILLGCSALFAFAPASLRAQDDEAAKAADDATVLETITVEGTAGDDDAKSIVATKTTSAGKIAADILDTPASVSVITAKEIQQRGAQSVEEVLDYTAGVTTDFYGSDDRFDYFKIRGFDAYAYRDGLTLGNPFGGIREEPYAFERVEVLKGANSTVFGVSNPGGSVNYTTKRPKSERFGEVYATGGSFGHAEAGFDVGDNITDDDTLSFRLTGKLQNAEKEYDYSRDDETFVMGGLTWRPSNDTSLTVVYDYLDKDGVPGGGGHPVGYDLDRSLFLGEPDYNYDTAERNTVSVMFDHAFGSGLTFNSNARYSSSDTGFGYAYVYEPVDNGDTIADRYFFGNDSSARNFVFDSRLQYDTSFGAMDSQTLVGVEYGNRTGDSDLYWVAAPGIDWTNPVYTGAPTFGAPYSSKKTKQTTTAIYGQQNLTFNDKLIVNLGLRNDWLDLREDNKLNGSTSKGNFSETTARVGLTYKLTKELAAFANYAQSVAPPAIGVEPERGEQYEIGLKYRPEAFPALFSVSVYDLTKSNITRTNPNTNQPETIGKVGVRGVDLEAKAELTDSISLTAAYSYLMSDIVENGTAGNEGNEMSFVPNHAASLWLNYELEGDGMRGDMTFGLGARYQGSYYFDDANTKSTTGSVVFDAAFSYEIRENTTLQVNVNNVFDEKHVAYGGFGADWYNPGRTVFATLRQTW
ncbi:TonB-dependent siderophore receptor [Pleomorphomonas sp. NRK KF1]|uniref:TonB-dependent siderophore receptor n=1 Tax=Pleomorphomonas sp. NRK KF1 TaxID=2943000 RepID=UPI00204387FC|nr:TonB-dependent siderophore receptor [Pleomorphomonas sp. NRK KF1]MCM5551993.1 TonB-dependent siderophore receptor [Pleomorphomonas sp. NRK KF1]